MILFSYLKVFPEEMETSQKNNYFVKSCRIIPSHQICVNCFTHIQSYNQKWHVGLLCKTLWIIQILLNCLILCDLRISWWEVCLNSSWNCLLWFFLHWSLNPLKVGDRLVKRVDFSKIQLQMKRTAKANFIYWTLFWRKCRSCLFFPVKWYRSYVQVFNKELSRFFTLDRDKIFVHYCVFTLGLKSYKMDRINWTSSSLPVYKDIKIVNLKVSEDCFIWAFRLEW